MVDKAPGPWYHEPINTEGGQADGTMDDVYIPNVQHGSRCVGLPVWRNRSPNVTVRMNEEAALASSFLSDCIKTNANQ